MSVSWLVYNVNWLCPDRRKAEISVAFVRPSVRLSVCPSVCSPVAYVANNSRTKKPSVPKFGRKVATRIPVSRSNGQRSGLEAGGGIPCRPNPAATLLVLLVIRILHAFSGRND